MNFKLLLVALTAISGCYINTVFAKNRYYIISIRRNDTDLNYDDASGCEQLFIDELVNDRMNDIYNIISKNKNSYISIEGKMDEKLDELTTVSSTLRKRDENEIKDDLESEIEIKEDSEPDNEIIENSEMEIEIKESDSEEEICDISELIIKIKEYSELNEKLKDSSDSEDEIPVKKFRFVNKNRPPKNNSFLSETKDQYISIESNLVSHIVPVLNYYTVKAYLSSDVAEKVRSLPNVISCEIAHKIEKPVFKKLKDKECHKKHKTYNSNKFKRSSSHYDLSYIKKETGWSDVSVQEYADAHLAVLSQYKYNSELINNFDYTYYYPSSAGKGIDIYLIDEGININHEDFDTSERTVICDAIIEGGVTTTTDNQTKKNCSIGSTYQVHGTMVSAVAGGKVSGVAKKANLHMLATDFYDYDFVVALDYVKLHGKPYKTVINISRNGVDVFSDVIQSKINELVDAGFIIVASSGNESEDACDSKYVNKFAGYDNVITVGATFNDEYSLTEAYTAAYYSNYGNCIDLQGPGYVRSADFSKCDESSSSMCKKYGYVEGTSFSSPIVSGMAAVIMSENSGTKFNYKTMRQKLIDMSNKNIVKNLGSSTPNRFVNNGKHIVYSSDNIYYGCGLLSGNMSCSDNKCCASNGYCISPDKDDGGLCKLENGCQSEFGYCGKAGQIVNPVDFYGMSLDTIKKSIEYSSTFELVFLNY